jgi:hypothetical protein
VGYLSGYRRESSLLNTIKQASCCAYSIPTLATIIKGAAATPSALVVRAAGLLVAVPVRRVILQPFLSRHLLNCGYLVRLSEVRIAL